MKNGSWRYCHRPGLEALSVIWEEEKRYARERSGPPVALPPVGASG
ncbi:hypothetical protein [Halomonas shantousis]